eukprot:scaffold106020_cov28-Tisochrysis_lutea.AAC.5
MAVKLPWFRITRSRGGKTSFIDVAEISSQRMLAAVESAPIALAARVKSLASRRCVSGAHSLCNTGSKARGHGRSNGIAMARVSRRTWHAIGGAHKSNCSSLTTTRRARPGAKGGVLRRRSSSSSARICNSCSTFFISGSPSSALPGSSPCAALTLSEVVLVAQRTSENNSRKKAHSGVPSRSSSLERNPSPLCESFSCKSLPASLDKKTPSTHLECSSALCSPPSVFPAWRFEVPTPLPRVIIDASS